MVLLRDNEPVLPIGTAVCGVTNTVTWLSKQLRSANVSIMRVPQYDSLKHTSCQPENQSSYGHVYSVGNVAVKVMKTFNNTNTDWNLLATEIYNLCTVKDGHPNVCTLLGVDLYANLPALVFPIYGPSLADVIMDGPIRNPIKRVRYKLQLQSVVQYLHTLGIIHVDIKPDNVCIKDRSGDNLVLIDFGSSENRGQTFRMDYNATTTFYSAPEQKSNEPNTPMLDVWSLGLTVYEMWDGVRVVDGRQKCKFRGIATRRDMRSITQAEIIYQINASSLSRTEQAYLKSLLIVDADDRKASWNNVIRRTSMS